MDALVRSAGFEKIDMRTDKDGIFTVSLARRISGPLSLWERAGVRGPEL